MKRKGVFLLVNLLMLTMGFVGCSNDNEKTKDDASLTLRNFVHTGCKDKATSAKAVSAGFPQLDGYEESVEYSCKSSGRLYIRHVNAVFNCCAEELRANASLTDNRIIITESEKSSAYDCICPYDLSFEVGPLTDGKYTVVINRDAQEYTTFVIDFDKNLSGRFVVPKEK